MNENQSKLIKTLRKIVRNDKKNNNKDVQEKISHFKSFK